MTNTPLKTLLRSSAPLDSHILIEEFCELCDRLNLKWVTPTKGGMAGKGVYFIASDLSIAKGQDVKDYAKNWADSNSTGFENYSEPSIYTPSKLPGNERLVKGKELRAFKQLYLEQNGEAVRRVPSLYILDWVRAYAYLVQGTSEVAKTFQLIGANVIDKLCSLKPISVSTPVPINKLSYEHLNSLWTTEESLVKDIIYLAAHSTYKLTVEVSTPDFDQSKRKNRRWDMVNLVGVKGKGRVVTLYEVKKNIIDLEDLVNTVKAKRYIELAQREYNTPFVNLILLAPWGGTPEALTECQTPEYDKVGIQTVRSFSQFLLSKAKRYHSIDPYYLNDMLPKTDTVKLLLSDPQQPLLTQSNNYKKGGYYAS
jgi:hypothetical protein